MRPGWPSPASSNAAEMHTPPFAGSPPRPGPEPRPQNKVTAMTAPLKSPTVIERAATPLPRPAIVGFRAVSKSFPARGDSKAVSALSGIDLDLPTGSILGVIGRSGAGKSTLIRLVNGLEKPTEGHVVVD